MKYKKYICIHGHFYQPPRENPWLGIIEKERSAFPHHNWNLRILNECYGPNSASPVLSADGRIETLINNYSLISFNFGPTLLSWLEKNAVRTYQAVLEADRASIAGRSGHGNAVAQVYNHVIMPLASGRDKRTQILWGVEDFIHRFKRKPEGLWLAEAAADDDTLEALCANGIKFTVLGNKQALKCRPIGSDNWQVDGNFDTTRPYRWFSKQQKGRFIDLFFYHGPLAQAVDFGDFLSFLEDPEKFSGSLFKLFTDRPGPQLASTATDGEFFGHHCAKGAQTLTEVLRKAEKEKTASITNYGEFLEKYPPSFEIEIVSPSSWSCNHGVDRWKDDCGCRCYNNPSWNQKWRKTLREAFNWLALETDKLYEDKAKAFFSSPWRTRDEYIHCMLERGQMGMRKFLSTMSFKHLSQSETRDAFKLLEMQKNRMLMFTSCGWFFDDISGLEPVQIMKYAARSMELASGFGAQFEDELLAQLENAKSNLSEFSDGKNVYKTCAKPSAITHDRAAAHACLTSMFGQSLPFLKQTRFRFKILEENRRAVNGGYVYYILANIETADTVEQELYFAAGIKRDSSALKCYVKKCAGQHDYKSVSADLETASASHSPGAAENCLEKTHNCLIFDLSAVFESERSALEYTAFAKNEALSAVFREWTAELRLIEKGLGISKNLLSILLKVRKTGIPYYEIPFIYEVRGYFVTHFFLALERRSAKDLEGSLELLEFFCAADSFWGIWEMRMIMHKWLKETPPGATDEKEFQNAAKKAAELLGIKFTYDHKKIKA